nr:ABC transporter substrate-binding protein [Bacteroidota bacterium]
MKSAIKTLPFFVVILAIITPLNAFPGKNDKTTQHVNLQLKWKHQFQFAGYYAAIEKGFYEEAGIQVNLIEAVEGQNPSDAVFAGKAEFGVCTSDILLMPSQEKDAVVLATVFQHSPQILLASRQSGISHVHDLIGKTIAMEPNAADIIAFMNDEGVSLDRCIIDQHAFNANGLISGEIDAISAYSTDEPFVLNEASFEYAIISPLMGGIDFYGDVLFSTEEFIRANPELVNRFLEASLKGWQYAMDHPEEIIELIYNRYSKRHSIEHLRFEAERMKNLVMADVVEIGYTNPGRWESISNTYKNLNMLDASFTTDGLLYSHYLKPKMNIPWNLIVIFLAIIVIIGSITYFFYNSSRKLKKEIRNRHKIEKDLLESEQRYRLLVETAMEGIMVAQDPYLKFVNPKMQELTGYNEADLLLLPFLEFIHPEDMELVRSNHINRMMGKAIAPRYHFRLLRKDKSIKWVEMSGVKIEWEGQPATLNLVTDISDRRIADQEIKHKNEELQKLNAEKDKFFSIIAHDLKSPFNSIIGFSELLAEQVREKDFEGIEKYAGIIHHSSERAMELLMNLMEWSRSQTGRMVFNPEYFEMVNLINETVLLFADTARHKSISIRSELPPNVPVYADRPMTNTIIRNLVSNAIKFTMPGGEIIISAEEKQNGLIVSVRDNGIGIPKSSLDKLFRIDQNFSTPGTQNEQGTGLGLVICKEFIEKHSGKIWVESIEGKGSTFFFSIQVKNNQLPSPTGI